MACEQPIGPGGATAPGPIPGGEPNTGHEFRDGTAAKATDPGNDPNCELIEKDDRGTERWLCSRAEGGPEGGGVICWYFVTVTRIVYDGKVEEVVTEELLYCEPDDGGCGGGGGGIGDDTLDLALCKDGKIALQCPYAVRGSEATCSVVNIGSHTLDLNVFNYEWSVVDGHDGSSGKGEEYASWSGIATTPRTVRVVVTQGSDVETLIMDTTTWMNVGARTVGSADWRFEEMTHGPYSYGLPDSARHKAWGAYGERVEHGAGAGVAREGTGPWRGEYYTYLPHRLRGYMFLHRDFDTSGDPRHSAHKTCPGKGIPSSANVLTVNTMCSKQHKKNLEDWRLLTIAHEQEHEDGANKCLTEGSAARDALREMERFTGTDQGLVQRQFNQVFRSFTGDGGPFKQAMETRTSTPVSPVIWEWRDNGAWTEQALRSFRHNGTDGC